MRINTHVTSTMLALSVFLLTCAILPSYSQDLDELQARFRARYAQILQFKREGKIGETFGGEVAAVDPSYLSDRTLSGLINEENADRRTLYANLAKQQNTTPEKVAERNALRNFQNAERGQFLKHKNGAWQRKP